VTSSVLSPPRSESSAIGRFEPTRATIPYERILRIQGYSDMQRIRPAIVAAARAAAALAPELAAPQVAYRRVPIRRIAGDAVVLDGDIRLHCAAFPQTLAGCTEAAAFVLTLGARIDERVIAQCDSGDLLDALLLETAAWLAIEDATRQFRGHLRAAAAARGQRTTSRMGPGYSYRIGETTCTWALEENQPLFALFGGARLPVTLMDSCAMQPKMSRSGLIGIGPRDGEPNRNDAGDPADYQRGVMQ
jgi:hypothetical protein